MEPIIRLPYFWNLDNNGNPDNISTIENTLDFLKNHPLWIKEHSEKAKPYIALLEFTHLKPNQLSETSWKTYASLFSRFPDLFPQTMAPNQVNIKIKNKIFSFPANHLLMVSHKFRRELGSGMKEERSNIIELDLSSYEENTAGAFLEFLKSGQLNLTEQVNILDLLCLADEHDVEILRQLCIERIENFELNLHELTSILGFGLDRNLTELVQFCIAYGVNHSKLFSDIKVEPNQKILKGIQILSTCSTISQLENRNYALSTKIGDDRSYSQMGFLPPFQDFLSALKDISTVLPIQEIHFKKDLGDFYEFKAICELLPKEIQKLTLNYPKLKFEDLQALKQFPQLKEFFTNAHQFLKTVQDVEKFIDQIKPVKIGFLNLKNVENLNDAKIAKLAKKIPDLKHLVVRSLRITQIPFLNLESLDCENCLNLRELTTNAKTISCAGCLVLRKVTAPNAEFISAPNRKNIKFEIPASCNVELYADYEVEGDFY